MPTPEENVPEKKPTSLSPVDNAKGFWLIIKDFVNDVVDNKNGKGIVTICAVITAVIVYQWLSSGKDNASSNLHQQNRADTTQAQMVQLLKEVIADKDRQIASKDEEIREYKFELKRIDTMNYRAATAIKRLTAGKEIRNAKP